MSTDEQSYSIVNVPFELPPELSSALESGLTATGILAPLQSYLTSKRIRRLESIVNSLRDELNRLRDSGKIDRDYSQSDEYSHLVVHGITRSQHEHREFKLRMMGVLLANLSGEDLKYSFDVKKMIVDVIAELNEHHIIVLNVLQSIGIKDVYANDFDGMTNASVLDQVKGVLNSIDPLPQLIQSSVEYLHSHGLVERVNTLSESITSHDWGGPDRDKSLSNTRCAITQFGSHVYETIQNSVDPNLLSWAKNDK